MNEIHPLYPLGTIVDLTAQAALIAEGRLAGNPAFRPFRLEDQADYRPDAPAGRVWNQFLETYFWRRDESGREEFLADLFYALSTFPMNPVWVTAWARLDSMLKAKNDRCLEALGMPRRDAPRILIALRYPVRDAGVVVRPCQLDGGDFVWHYPSPPKRAVRDGGVTMDLMVPRHSIDLIPEYIHAQILFKVDHWKAAGRWTAKTQEPVLCDLAAARRQHREALRHAHPPEGSPWMEEGK